MINETDRVLARYFGGNASEMDKAYIEEWISSSPEHQLEFDKMTKLYQLLGSPDDKMSSPNTEQAKKKFMAYIAKSSGNTNTPPKRIPFQQQWMWKVAAVVLVLLMSSVVLWNQFFAEKEMVLIAHSTAVEKILPDSTKIRLAENSKITYSSEYGKTTKSVYLEGKASFNVGKTEKVKLQVRADELVIEDIGTIFEVTAYKDSNFIRVKVFEGQIHMFTNEDKGLVLDKNTTGYYYKQTKKFVASAASIDKLQSGHTRVNFKGISLGEAINTIANAYDVEIRVADNEILNQRITVEFEGEDLAMVLQIIAETMDLKVLKIDNVYLFSSKS